MINCAIDLTIKISMLAMVNYYNTLNQVSKPSKYNNSLNQVSKPSKYNNSLNQVSKPSKYIYIQVKLVIDKKYIPGDSNLT